MGSILSSLIESIIAPFLTEEARKQRAQEKEYKKKVRMEKEKEAKRRHEQFIDSIIVPFLTEEGRKKRAQEKEYNEKVRMEKEKEEERRYEQDPYWKIKEQAGEFIAGAPLQKNADLFDFPLRVSFAMVLCDKILFLAILVGLAVYNTDTIFSNNFLAPPKLLPKPPSDPSQLKDHFTLDYLKNWSAYHLRSLDCKTPPIPTTAKFRADKYGNWETVSSFHPNASLYGIHFQGTYINNGKFIGFDIFFLNWRSFTKVYLHPPHFKQLQRRTQAQCKCSQKLRKQ